MSKPKAHKIFTYQENTPTSDNKNCLVRRTICGKCVTLNILSKPGKRVTCKNCIRKGKHGKG
jgi:hypothetical protein